MMSTALLLMSISAMFIASSPLVGWLTSSDSREMPSFFAQLGSSACSASMKAAMPPARWAAATACSAIVVLPDDSGPNTSMIRPRGKPLPPRARSTERLPDEIPSIGACRSAPRGMIEPSPNSFSICASVFRSAGLSSRNAWPDLAAAPFLDALPSSSRDSLSLSFAALSSFFPIRPFTPANAVTMATISHGSRHIVGVVASPP